MKRKSLLKLLFLIAICFLLTGFVCSCETPPDNNNPPSSNTGDCPAGAICRDDAPGAYSRNGAYRTDSYSLPRTATPAETKVYYPTNATAPFSGLVFCPPYTATQAMFAAWGPFFASHGIVLVTMNTTTTMVQVDQRDDQQRKVLDALKAENTRSGSPLNGKLATDRIGAVGWSMGGGATWINSAQYPGLKTAFSLAGHNMTAMAPASKGGSTKCPTLLINGATDSTILGGMGQSDGVYRNIPSGIPKVFYEVRGKGHMTWGSPTAGGAASGEIALAFQKTFLDGDLRWAKFIKKPSNASKWETANIPN